MRAQRFIWIAGGVLMLIAALLILLMSPKPPPSGIMVQVSGVTNIPGATSRTVLVSNATDRTLNGAVWIECQSGPTTWQRTNWAVGFFIPPHDAALPQVASPHGKARVAVQSWPVITSPFGKWLNRLRALIGLDPNGSSLTYVEIE